MKICSLLRGAMAFALIASLLPIAAVAAQPDVRSPRLAERQIEVTVAAEPGITLAGTLRLPGEARSPLPVVLMLPGHGPWEGGGFARIADRLAALGIASLEYDKRGIGQSTGTFDDRMEPIARDAAAAIAWLRTRSEIDGRRIAVLGLSQGGAVAPALAAADPLVAAVVTLAGPAGRRGALFIDSMRETLVQGGMERAAAERVVAAAHPYMTALSGSSARETILPLQTAASDAFIAAGWSVEQTAGAIATLSNPVVVSQFRLGVSEALEALKVPVLSLYASQDDVVMNHIAIPAAKAALAANARAAVIELPHVNHIFQRRSGDAVATQRFDGPVASDPIMLDVVTGWLGRQLLDDDNVRTGRPE